MKATRKQLVKFAEQQEQFRDTRIKLAAAGKISPNELNRGEKMFLASLLLEKKRRRGLKDLYYFCKYVLGYRDMSDMHKELTSHVIKRTKKGNLRTRKLILEPRGSFKSSVVTIGYPLWRVVKDPNLRVLIDSEEFGKSKAFLREIRDHITHNEEFRRLYGKLDAKRYTDIWQEHQFNVAGRTQRRKEPNFSCAGVDVTKVGMHYDLIICDDLVSEKNITTPEQLEKVYKHYRLLLSLLDPGCELIIIGTRWHFADLYGQLLEEDEKRVALGQTPKWKKLIRPAIFPDGSLLFPERLTKRYLDGMKAAQGSYIFSCQYLNDPAGAEDAAFKVPGWIQWFTDLPKGQPLNFVILVDPSVGQSRDSDYTAIVTVAVDPMYNWYVLNVDRGRWNPTQIIQGIVRARKRVLQRYKDTYPTAKEVRVALEVVAFQRVLKHFAKDLMRRREIDRFRIIELKTDTHVAKDMRIRGLVPFFEGGKVFFKGKGKLQCQEGIQALYNEMREFPVGRTKDALDALAYLPQIVKIPDALKPYEPAPNVFGEIKKRARRYANRGLRQDGDPVVGSRMMGGNPWQR